MNTERSEVRTPSVQFHVSYLSNMNCTYRSCHSH